MSFLVIFYNLKVPLVFIFILLNIFIHIEYYTSIMTLLIFNITFYSKIE